MLAGLSLSHVHGALTVLGAATVSDLVDMEREDVDGLGLDDEARVRLEHAVQKETGQLLGSNSSSSSSGRQSRRSDRPRPNPSNSNSTASTNSNRSTSSNRSNRGLGRPPPAAVPPVGNANLERVITIAGAEGGDAAVEYHLLGLLGDGGYSSVELAERRDRGVDRVRRVAVKFPSMADHQPGSTPRAQLEIEVREVGASRERREEGGGKGGGKDRKGEGSLELPSVNERGKHFLRLLMIAPCICNHATTLNRSMY